MDIYIYLFIYFVHHTCELCFGREPSQLLSYKQIFAAVSKEYKEHVHTFCGQNLFFFFKVKSLLHT
jgi:hypothetical protein